MGLGSGIWEKLIPDPGPGVKKAPDPGAATLVEYNNYSVRQCLPSPI
jgi:hypothetical protein